MDDQQDNSRSESGQSLSRYELRLRLTEAGFEVVPLAGKACFLHGWQKRGLATEHEIRMWDTYVGMPNTGILTAFTPFLDIDILDPEAAEAVEQLVAERFDGQNVLCRIGQAPKRAIPFQTTTPFSKILVKLLAPNGAEHKLEFLGQGQQAVVYGIHPHTKQPYFWPHGGLLDFRRDDLPGITPDGARALILAVTEMLIHKYHYRLKQAPKGEPSDDHAPIEWGDYLADPLDHEMMVAFVISSMKAGVPDAAVSRLVRELVECVEPRDADQKARQERRLEEIPAAVASARRKLQADADDLLSDPDLSITQLGRRLPPPLPLELFGPEWAPWIAEAATAAACPPDYVAAPLLAAASVLIGNARWAQAALGWREPPHLWCCPVGDSGNGKSPGADCLRRDVLHEIEKRMIADFPDQWRDWKIAMEASAQEMGTWKADVREARKKGEPPPPPPADAPDAPQEPRLRQSDVTIEKVASLLATAAPKGLLIERDELAGWLLGMTTYNEAGRAFWIEAYGGRPYRVERQKASRPIVIPRLAVAVYGGTQPDRLAEMFRDADDGLLSRFLWFWPEPLPFRLGTRPPNADWAVAAFDRLRLLDLVEAAEGDTRPFVVALDTAALPALKEFGREMQNRQQQAGGLMRSAFGKARGTALRLSLVLEYLWWCGREGYEAGPATISCAAFAAAARMVSEYLMPMAERVYGDAGASDAERRMATLARWVLKTKATEVHVRHLQREVRLPGLRDAATIKATCDRMMEAGWLSAPRIGFGAASKVAYRVNPLVLGQES
jgi:hypothetical protein